MISDDLGTPLSDAELNSDRSTHASPILLCPADPYPAQGFPSVYGTSSVGARRRSYAIVCCPPTFGLSDQFLGVAGGIWVDGGGGPPPTWKNMTVKDLTLPRSKVLDSAETLLVVEAPSSGNFAGGDLAMADRPQDQFWGLSLGGIALTPASTSRTPHGSTWNYLFCDGHVAPLAWNETVRNSGDFTTNLQSMNYLWTRNPSD
jgi:prepilin-type processing-associated H-X9-DG protein